MKELTELERLILEHLKTVPDGETADQVLAWVRSQPGFEETTSHSVGIALARLEFYHRQVEIIDLFKAK